MKPLVWHYTVGAHMPSILGDGMLRTTDVFIDEGERPAVWFTERQDWEPTANKGIARPDGKSIELDEAGTERRFGPLVRFGVDPEATPLITWKEFKLTSGIGPRSARALEQTTRAKGSNPDHHFASYDPIPRSAWIIVEARLEGEWLPLDLNSAEEGDSTVTIHPLECAAA